ncbi:Serine/threonine-protein kinase plk4 [Mortierella sp. 14UC]|nr:Serine/threonine-protein kinase plk4 [Mortierella sp. 14UC]
MPRPRHKVIPKASPIQRSNGNRTNNNVSDHKAVSIKTYVDLPFGEIYEVQTVLRETRSLLKEKVKDQDGCRYKLKTFKGKTHDLKCTVAEVRQFGFQLLQDVANIHKQGVLHCNLHLEVLYLTNAGCVGEDGYLSPETVDRKPHSAAIDLWAIGCILFQMLEGRLPGLTTRSTVNRSKNAMQGAGMPVEAGILIAKALYMDPQKRITIERL